MKRRNSIHSALKEHSSPDKRFQGAEWQLLFDEESKYPYHYNARTGETKWAEEEEAASTGLNRQRWPNAHQKRKRMFCGYSLERIRKR